MESYIYLYEKKVYYSKRGIWRKKFNFFHRFGHVSDNIPFQEKERIYTSCDYQESLAQYFRSYIWVIQFYIIKCDRKFIWSKPANVSQGIYDYFIYFGRWKSINKSSGTNYSVNQGRLPIFCNFLLQLLIPSTFLYKKYIPVKMY